MALCTSLAVALCTSSPFAAVAPRGGSLCLLQGLQGRRIGGETAAFRRHLLSFAGTAGAPFHPSFPVYSDNELAATGVSSLLA